MTSKPRGYCVIINNKNFIRLKKRKGTDQDALLLKETFEWLGFLVELYEDQTAERMRSIMEDYSKKCHTDNDCFVACLLSHGKRQVVCGTDGGLVTVEEILKPFEGNMCSALLTKPKVFFIQACQGSDRQGFVTLQEDSLGDRSLEDDGLIKIPVQADFLIGMSTVQGCKSMRNERSGTWYIQSLCQRLKAHCPKGVDVLTILTDVSHDVSRNDGVIKEDGKSVPVKQIPELRSTLTSTLVFPVPE
ncbi:hypothetical protein Z043_109250 [Scleropages formosus]|uniref:Caspase-8 n=1 Tax=Scleropages formosus TaxID=113540 RepID=A0A0P7XAP1_SCLFO|nr:hypothetical protein Z043_109250 [Scleropages formosus]